MTSSRYGKRFAGSEVEIRRQLEDAMKNVLLMGAAVALLVFFGRRALRYADPDVSVYGQPAHE